MLKIALVSADGVDMQNPPFPLRRRADAPHRAAERGAALVQYALLITLIALGCILSLRAVGNSIDDSFAVSSLALVDDGTSNCTRDERTTYRTVWQSHVAERAERRANGTWTGAANRDTRIAWIARRDELRTIKAGMGC